MRDAYRSLPSDKTGTFWNSVKDFVRYFVNWAPNGAVKDALTALPL